ncbi:hypothetical protein [Streptomyces avermitilis]|uniref:hypothetical protein n=1 Tax=Streptomyces avermitilis TaxID=33903 RepID=UPI0037221C41
MQIAAHAWTGEEHHEPLKGLLSLSNEELGSIFREGVELMLDDNGPMLTPTFGNDRMRVVLMPDQRFVSMKHPRESRAMKSVLTDQDLTHAARLVWAHLHNSEQAQRQITVARALGMDKGTVARSLVSLSLRGLAMRVDGLWGATSQEVGR